MIFLEEVPVGTTILENKFLMYKKIQKGLRRYHQLVRLSGRRQQRSSTLRLLITDQTPHENPEESFHLPYQTHVPMVHSNAIFERQRKALGAQDRTYD